MANLPISGLPAAAALTGVEPTPVVQAGVTVQTPSLAIAALSKANYAYSGRFIFPEVQVSGNLPTGANRIAYLPIEFHQSGSIISLTIDVTSAAGVGSTGLLGVYADNAGVPGALLQIAAAAATTDSPGIKTQALVANLAFTPGLYWVASMYSSTPTLFSVATSDNVFKSRWGTTTAGGLWGANVAVFENRTFGLGLPNPATPVFTSNAAAPLLGVGFL